jgi:hypothetical protein
MTTAVRGSAGGRSAPKAVIGLIVIELLKPSLSRSSSDTPDSNRAAGD